MNYKAFGVAMVITSGTLFGVPSLASAGICQDEHESRLEDCRTMPTIPRIVCVVVSNEMLNECIDTKISELFDNIIKGIAPNGHLPHVLPGVSETIDIELVALSFHIEIEILPGNGDPQFSLPTIPTSNGFSFELDGDDLAPYFDDGYIVSLLAFDNGDAFVGGGAFVVPAPNCIALFAFSGLIVARRRR